MKSLFPNFVGGLGALGLLAIRLAAGSAFILHGLGKFQHGWMNWAGDAYPPIAQAAASSTEFIGGVLLVLGLLTPLAAILIGAVMITAITTHHLRNGDPFVNLAGGSSWELAAIYLASMIGLLFNGPGRISIDSALWGKSR